MSAVAYQDAYKEIFIYDLISNLRRNPDRARLVQRSLDNIRSLQTKVATGKANREEVRDAMAQVVKDCGWNFGLLLPYVFPRYPAENPLSLIARPFMFTMTTMDANNILTLRAGRQVGKCVDGETEVQTRRHGTLTMAQLYDLGDCKNDKNEAPT